MSPRVDFLLRGFSFQLDYQALRYIAVCSLSLAGAVVAAYLTDGDVPTIVLAGAACYIAGRLAVWVIYH